MKKIPENFFSNNKGATALEYGLIIAFVVLAIILALLLLGTSVQGLFNHVLMAFSQ